MRPVKLSEAQVNALICSGIVEAPEPDDAALLRAWRKGDENTLEFEPAESTEIWRAINELSNGEDAIHCDENRDRDERTYAGRASRSLAALARKIPLK